MTLCISMMFIATSPFSFLILLILLSTLAFFFSWWVWLKDDQFSLFKEKLKETFSFIGLFIGFVYLYFIYLCSDLYDIVPSAKLWVLFVLLFLAALGVNLVVYLAVFLFSEVRLCCCKLPSYSCFGCVPYVLDPHVLFSSYLGIFFSFCDFLSDPLVI